MADLQGFRVHDVDTGRPVPRKRLTHCTYPSLGRQYRARYLGFNPFERGAKACWNFALRCVVLECGMLFPVGLLLVVMALAAARAEPASSSPTVSCPVTIPTGPAQPADRFTAAAFNYGNRHLRAELYWPRGTLTAGTLPNGGAMAVIKRDGSIWAKVGWWRGIAGEPAIRGRRLDRRAPPLRADVPAGYGSRGFLPSGLTFPTVGCWRVVGELGPARLTFVVRVAKVKRH